MTMNRITIAIDGYSSCGKSTIAKGLAKKIGYIYVDSGAMYRAVTLYCMKNKIIVGGKFSEDDVVSAMNRIKLSFDVNPLTHLSEMYLNGTNVEKEIREAELYIANLEKGIRATELNIAKVEKEIRAIEFVIANGEKAIRAAELLIANVKKFN